MRRMGRNLAVAACLLAAWSASAQAEETKVEVRADVVHASNQGNVIQPALLATLKADLEKQGRRFSSLKALSSQKLLLLKAKPVTVSLPDGRAANLNLVDVKDGVGAVKVSIPQKDKSRPLVEMQFTLAKEKSSFIHMGAYDGGDLILVVSPPNAAQPRAFIGRPLRPVVAAPERAAEPMLQRVP